MKTINIDFIDFWEGFKKKDNFFYGLLSEKYNVVISNTPELIIYSCFGEEYLKYSCKRIFYTGENIRPDFTACDFAFTFDYTNHKRHFRLPLYYLYMEQHKMSEKFSQKVSENELKNIWQKKDKFCCMVVSSPKSKFRLDFYKKLNKLRRIDSGGKIYNNVGGRVENKIEFIKNYKFVIAFENSSFPGYTTEKILEPFFVDSIPIYWGNKFIERDFNPKRFLNYRDFNSVQDLYTRLLEIDKNPKLALEILKEPIFSKDKISYSEEKKKVLNYISYNLEENNFPIAQTYFKYFHKINLIKKKIIKKLQTILTTNLGYVL